MSSTTHTPSEGLPPPKTHVGAWAWLRSRLFSSPLNILITVLLAWFLLMSVPALVEWAFIKANFTAANAQECRASVGGACWAFIIEKHRLILFGTYPYDEQWRPLIATIILVAVIVCSGIRRFWNWKLAIIWTVGLTAVAILMWGGVLGLTYVENARWGGLPLTLILSTFGIAFAFPIGVLLALGRRSKMPAIKALCVVYIELIRGVPLISLLFMSSVMLPLFLPEGFSIDKLLRAQIAIIMFAAAYIAETVRGGLQAIPKGPVRRRRLARPELLAADAQDHPAAGAQDRDPAAGQHLHRAVQGHVAGGDHRHLRPDAGGQGGPVRRGMARIRGGGVSVHLADLLRLLLLHVQIQPGAGKTPGHGPRTLEPCRGSATGGPATRYLREYRHV